MANILLKLSGENQDAKEVIDDTRADIEEFKKTGAATVDLRVDAEQAKRDIAEVRAELEAIPKEETIRIRMAAEQAKLQSLLARKQGIESQLQNAATAGEDTGPLIQRLGAYNSRIEAVRSRVEGLASDFEQLGQKGEQDLSRLERGATGLAGGITKARVGLVGFTSDLVGKVPLLGGVFSSIVDGVGKLASSLLPEAAQGFSGLASAAVGMLAVAPIMAAIVAAVAALVVSLGEALIGIAALAVGFMAALGPIAILLGVVLVKIKDIVSGQYQLRQANANLKSATDSQRQAVTQLHQAEQMEAMSRIQALNAEAQAYNAVLDAVNQVKDAQLGIQSARLQVQQATLTLLEFKQQLAGMGTTPGSLFGKASNVAVGGSFGQTQEGASPYAWLQMLLQYKQDLLQTKTAAQGVKDAVGQLRDSMTNQTIAARNWALFAKNGLKGYQPYAEAMNQVVTAEQNLTKADDALRSAEVAKQNVIKHGWAQESKFMQAWKKIRSAFGKVLGPAETAVFDGIEKSLGIMAKHMGPLTPAFTKLGVAIGHAFVWWAKMMVKPGNMALIVGLIKDAAKLTTSMSHWLGEVFKLLVRIAVSALPKLVAMVKHWASELVGVNKHGLSIQKFIDKCISKATTFWHVLQNIATVVKDIAGLFGTVEKVIKIAVAPFKAAYDVGKGLGNLAHEVFSGQSSKIPVPSFIHTKAQYRKWATVAATNSGEYAPQQVKSLVNQAVQAWWQQTHEKAQNVSSLARQRAQEAINAATHAAAHPVARPVVAVPQGVATPTPRVIAPQQHDHHWHLNQGDTINSPDHFASVVKKKLKRIGG